MPEGRLGPKRGALIALVAAIVLVPGLGRSGRLTYHEAFVAQAAREMIADGAVLVPTIGGLPWLEKPPLGFWLVALAGRTAGGVSELVARLPSALAAGLLILGVAIFAARRFGPSVGLLAALIQATTAWTVMRGRLAEVDVLLACLVAWAIVAFDRLRGVCENEATLRPWRWLFFAAVGVSGLAKGIGFGAVLIGAVVLSTLAWDRDREALGRLRFARGWLLAAVMGLTWPVLVALRHPTAVGLWALHVTDRVAAKPEHFISMPWWQYTAGLLAETLPWAPLALVGAWRSLGRAVRGRAGGDRLLWAWAGAPLLLLSLATVKSPHYAIHALPPWSVWAALSVVRLGERLQGRGWSPARLRRWAWTSFAGIGLAYALGYLALGPRLDTRGIEWAFYEASGRRIPPGEPLALVYNVPDWDRLPYPSPFGPVPHDLAVRLYYLNRPACWRFGASEVVRQPPASSSHPFSVIGRACDIPALRRLGRVETLARGPTMRRDRSYLLLRVTPDAGETLADRTGEEAGLK